MLYLIGLGLNLKGISHEGLEIVKRSKKVYLENYTVDFPYSLSELVEELGKKVISADRDFVEGLGIVDEAKRQDVVLLVYGSPLFATTHITLLQEAKVSRVKVRVIHAASVFDAIAESGLQLYKFGKIASMPSWKENYTPDSFMKVVQDNMSMKAHSLILVDIGLDFKDAIEQLKISAAKNKVTVKDLVICQSLGTKSKKFRYGKIEEFEGIFVKKPYCIIIPSKLHFVEKEFLEKFKK